MAYLYVVLGLIFLFLGAEIVLRGAVGLARTLKISALIVSLTIVAFATSAPELVISVLAALEDAPTLAVSNIVGSNIANILLILGVTACITAIPMSLAQMRFSGLIVLISATLIGFIGYFSPLTFWIGISFIIAMIVYILLAYFKALKQPAQMSEDTDSLPSLPIWKAGSFLVLGIAGLIGGSHFLVEGAMEIARDNNVSERVIGLTLVAVGTSLPELATSIVAALRKQVDVALGNALGSNISNTLLILGTTALVTDVPITDNILKVDIPVMITVSTLILILIIRQKPLTRTSGMCFLLAYAAYMAYVSAF